VAEGTGRVKRRDTVRVVVTQALFGVAVLIVVNARRHHRGLAAIGEVIVAGLVGLLATLLVASDR